MATFGEIQTRVNSDCLNRTDLSAETVRAIRSSIRHYERNRFWFNESSTALATVSSQSHISRPTAFFEIDIVRFFYDASASYELSPVDMRTLLQMRAGAQTFGDPTHYCIFGERIELFPIPTSAEPVVAHGFQQLTTLSGTADTNGWTSAAEDLIVYHSAKLMWATVLRNTQQAQVFAELERDSLRDLHKANDQRMLTAIKASD